MTRFAFFDAKPAAPVLHDPDAALVARAAGGEVAAFEMLVERHERAMTALVSRMVADPHDVDDIVQELFVRAWKGLPRFRGDAQFSTWLYRIAVNTAIKYRSRRQTEKNVLSFDALEGGADALGEAVENNAADPALALLQNEQRERLREAVFALPPKQRAVVVLHYFEGFSCEEISRIVDCSVGTVWSRLHYACKRLKHVLERQGDVG